MEIIVADNYERQSEIAADLVAEVITKKPDAWLGTATGSSPLGMYHELIKKYNNKEIDFSKVHTVNLDEYVGLPGTHEQSFRYYLNKNFFEKINIVLTNTHAPVGVGDLEENISEYNTILKNHDIDIQVLGVGDDGHLGFNEPGETLYDLTHVEELDERTVKANARFFDDISQVPTKAITMGMGNILRAKQLLLIVSGNKDAAMKKLLLDDRIDPKCPVTLLKLHRNAKVILTKDLLTRIS